MVDIKGLRKRTLETRLRLSLSHKGPRPWMVGKKRSLETRKKMSLAHRGKKFSEEHKKNLRGPRGKQKLILKKSEKKHLDSEYQYWARTVKNRDKWKCKLINLDCNGRLEAHHIHPWRDYKELRYIINNGITLCHFHHPRKREEEKRMIPIFQELLSVSSA